jgi:hypothetical protein
MADERVAKHRAHLGSKQDLRPIFTSLNGDNSWLLSFPRPEAERESSSKAYFHIVHDPWLNGPDVQYSSWLIHLSLSSTPAVINGAGVEDLIFEIESAAAEAGIVPDSQTRSTEGHSPIDAILINFHYGDHLHVPTLLTFSSSIPVFTTTDGAPIIEKLNHFNTIATYTDLPASFLGTWNSLPRPPLLPSYITLFRIQGHHELNFLTALLWSPTPSTYEVVLYSPHGLHTATPALQSFLHHAEPEFETLALLHGLKESWTLNWQTTFGAKSGLELFRQSRARYWVSTHNDQLGYGGLVWWLVKDIFRTVEWALGQEKGDERGKDVQVEEVKNGECFVLV